MRTNPYTVKPVPGLKRSGRRAIAFLSSDVEKHLDAGMEFERLKEKMARGLRSRFDYWIDGGKHDKYFHGWPNDPRYDQCFVFKWKDGRLCHRMYGFLSRPRPLGNPRFQVCILTSHAIKTTWETDPGELDSANAVRADPQVVAAIQEAFRDSRESRKQWLN